jgi:hypothetical protein
MKLLILSAIIACGAASSASAQQCLDQDASANNACMAGFGQVDLAQSFIQSAAGNINGAGIYMNPSYGSPETLTIGLWDNLPNAGGNLLASGTGLASPGSYFDVSWPCVNVTAGMTYYLVFSSTASMCYDGDVNNGYPNGMVFANPGYGAFPGFDYTFRTYNCCGSGGPVLSKSGICPGVMTISVTGATPNAQVAILYGAPGSFTRQNGLCAGTTVAISNPTLGPILTANGAGLASLSFSAPPGICGRTVQCVDLSSCVPTNSIIL